jgi:hypothetical protein
LSAKKLDDEYYQKCCKFFREGCAGFNTAGIGKKNIWTEPEKKAAWLAAMASCGWELLYERAGAVHLRRKT